MADVKAPWPESTREELIELMCGDAECVRMLYDLSKISHHYDDIVDSFPVSSDTAHELVWKLMFDLPLNRFYAANEHVLRPVIITGLLNWIAANEMEQSGSLEELRIAHATRYSISDVGLLCMYLLGGRDHAMKNARRWRLLSQQDTWDHYKSEHPQCR